MINDPSKVVFSTRYNIQKRYLDGTETISVTGSTTAEYSLITHSLGYIPTVRVFYKPVAGQLWPLSPHQYSSAGGGSGTSLNVTGSVIVTTSEVKLVLTNGGSTTNVDFTYRIYVDE